MNVDKVIKHFGGRVELVAILKKQGINVAPRTPYIWSHRQVIPCTALLALTLYDPSFNPRKFGWAP